jgi:hypothetical protein
MPLTPMNEGFFIAAYAAAIVIYSAYAASIGWRRRALRRVHGIEESGT